MDMSLCKLRELMIDREAWRAAIHGLKGDDISKECTDCCDGDVHFPNSPSYQ